MEVQSHNSNFMALCWTGFIITTVLFFSRCYVRVQRHFLSWDDLVMLLAWMLYFAGVILTTYTAHIGGWRHIYDIPPNKVTYIAELILLNQVFCILAQTAGKTSIALLIPRLLGTTSRWRLIVLYVNAIIQTCVGIVCVFIVLFGCNPISAAWNRQLLAEGKAKCIPAEANYAIGLLQCAIAIYFDFFLALFPITFIYKLKISLRTKIGLCFLLGLGIVAGIFGIIKTTYIPTYYHTQDLTWDSWGTYVWAYLETPMVIVAGSVPGCKPLWDRLLKGKPIAIDGSGAQTVRTDTGHSRNSSVVGKVRLLFPTRSAKFGSTSDESTMLADRQNTNNEVFVHRTFMVEESRNSSSNRTGKSFHGGDIEWEAGIGPEHRAVELPTSEMSLRSQ